MKLFYSKGACSLVVRIVLNELNVPFQDEAVDLRAKKTASGADYWAINAKGAVPALLLDNGELLTENQVILQYLADNTPVQKVLAPVGDMKRYQVLEWLNFIATELHKSFGTCFNPNIPEDIKQNILLPVILKKFEYVNTQLANKTFLTGAHFSLPDAYIFVMLRWAQRFQLDFTSLHHLNDYFQRLIAHPSVVKSLEQEGL